MKHKSIQIPDDISAKYGHAGQGKTFDDAFKTIIAVHAKDIPLYKQAEKKPKGRPKKPE